jgi:hypothetical protein
VIRKPASRAHVEITDELVERLQRDTPTIEALPLLAFTLEKLYRGYASDGKLELQEYVSLGGMEGSIQTCIERIVPRDSLSARDEAALRLSFVKHLAQANDKGEVVRLRARWDDLPSAAKPILEKFVNERLLIRSESKDEDKPELRSVTIEVAHEAMFRCWSDLKEWLRASADMLRWRRDVRRDRDNDPKWTGLRPAQLAVARDWPKRRRDELTAEEVDWINRGILWERIRRGIGATVVLVVALFAGIAWWQRDEAKRQAAIAMDQEKIANERLEATQSALTDDFFRTIGVSNEKIPRQDEREALWELAQLDRANAAVRVNLLHRWFDTPDTFVRGEDRDGQGFRAATGLNVEYHRRVTSKAAVLGDRLAAALENPQETDPYRLSILVQALAALADRMEPQAAAEIAKGGAQRLAAALENQKKTNSVQLSRLGQAVAALANRMEPQAAAEIAKGFAAALENTQETNPYRLYSLSQALAALANRMEPQAAAEIAKRGAQRLAAALQNPQETGSQQLSSLANALAALATKIEPQAAAEEL